MLTIEEIQKKVANHYDIKFSDMFSSKRSKTVAVPRQIAMYLCRSLTDDSLSHIGELLGKKDHTTIIHGCEKIANEIKVNEQLKATVETLKKKIDPN